jgi:hypothetical protein
MTTIELTDEDAKLFVRFRENQAFFERLLEANVTEVRGGHVTLHFNPCGQLMKIETNIVIYKK